MLKILQAKLQRYMNWELPDVQAGFRKCRGARDQIANIHWIIEKAKEFQEDIYFCFTDYATAFDCVDHSKLWKILKDMGISDHITCLLETCMQFKKQQLEPDMELIQNWERGSSRLYVVCLFNFYAKSIVQNAELDESQARTKIARKNNNKLWYVDDTTLMAESKEELKSLLMRVKGESEKAGLKFNIQKTRIMASSRITSWQIEGEKVEAVTDFLFLGSQITEDSDCSH